MQLDSPFNNLNIWLYKNETQVIKTIQSDILYKTNI